MAIRPPPLPRIKSPCVNICTVNAETRHCEGCGRTLREIANDIQSGLASLPDISKVELKNAPPFEISVEVSEDKKKGLVAKVSGSASEADLSKTLGGFARPFEKI